MMTRAVARRQKTEARGRAPRASRRANARRDAHTDGSADIRTFGRRPTARAFFHPPTLFREDDGVGVCAGTNIRIITILNLNKKHVSQIRDGARCRVSISRAAVEGIFEGIIFDVHGVKTSTIRDLTPRHDLYRSRSRGNDGDDGDDRARTHRRVVVRPHGSNTHSRHRTHAKQKHSLTK
jgi:hypothetical protein